MSHGDESLLLIALLRTLWRLRYHEMYDWLVAWPVVCQRAWTDGGRVLRPPQTWKRAAPVQDLIHCEFGPLDNAHAVCTLLRNLGFSFHKSALSVSLK